MKQRFITGLLTAAIFLALMVYGSIPFAAVILLLACIGFYEFITMNGWRWHDYPVLIGFAGISLFLFPSLLGQSDPLLPWTTLIWFILLALFLLTVLSKNKWTVSQISIVFSGMLYISFGFYYMTLTRIEFGLFYTLLIFICVWMTDIGAYFTGMVIGRHKLWPSISPKKTVEGAIGGICVSILIAILFSLYDSSQLSLIQAILFGLVIAVGGQVGDFIESAYKRACQVKDSGKLFPGHGGVLDRTDSWIIVFPLIHFLYLLHG